MSVKELQKYTYFSKYARYKKEAKRRETWDEAVDRMKQMHLRRYPQVGDEINWAFEYVRDQKVLGSQRALQYGGNPIEQKHARLYNCVGRETEFITSEGVRSFTDFADGDQCVVLSHKGNWKRAVVRNYGKQKLHNMTITRGRAKVSVRATKNHRWLLKDGTVTQSVAVEDQLMFAPNVASDFVYDEAEPLERLYWAYGYVFGDGTLQKDAHGEYKYSQVRLCGDEVKYLDRFLELGFGSSTSASLEGDVMAYTGKYLKTLPDPKRDSPALIRAFVHGYLAADGIRNSNSRGNPNYRSPSPYDGIQATGEDAIAFIRECFPIAGVYIVSEEDLTGQVTNYGKRDELTIRFRVISGFGKTAPSFKVTNISEDVVEEDVWCLEVEDDHSFVLPNGLVTGNCCVSYCDRLRFFQESFWLLLCGCGTGFSAQRHHVAKLPPFSPLRASAGLQTPSLPTKTYVVPDTIEGWGDALGVLLSSYFEDPVFPEYANCKVDFDTSLVRKKGSLLSSGAGKAPGPEPLVNSLEKICTLLDRCLRDGQDRLRPIDAYDIVMHASDAVLSGGVRRSATICIFSDDDEEMLAAKTGNWCYDNPQRARSNNSVMLIRGQTTRERFMEIINSVKQFGEPGFVWADSTEIVLNPCCFDPDTRIATREGLVRIEDLYKNATDNEVVTDLRVGRGDGYTPNAFGTAVRRASKALLTQKSADLYEVQTEHGNVLRVTNNHKFPTVKRGRLQLRDLRAGDSILLQSDEGVFGDIGSYDHGLIAGMVAGDGTVHDKNVFVDVWEDDFDSLNAISDIINRMPEVLKNYNPYKWVDQTPSTNGVEKKRTGGRRLRRVLENVGIDPASLKDRVPESVWRGSKEMVIGYIDGLVFADGSVQYTDRGKKSSLSLRITQPNKPLLEDVQTLLLNFGVVSRLYHRHDAGPRLLPDGYGGKKFYECDDVYELIVNRPNIIKLIKAVGLFGRKRQLLSMLLQNAGHSCRKPERFITKIKSITHVGKSDVYCLEEPETNCLIANGVVTGNCEIGMWPVDVVTKKTGWQMCVSGDTKLLTKEGVVQIGDCVGEEVEVWNGEKWSKTKPFITGHDRKLYRVSFNDGSYLDCTDNHKFLVKDRFMRFYHEVQTKDLMSFSKYNIHVPRSAIKYGSHGGNHVPYAYEYGFVLGDGTARHDHSPFASLYKDDMKLGLKAKIGEFKYNENGTPCKHATFELLDKDFSVSLKYDKGLPREIFSWDSDSIAEFVGGWIDADGSQANKGCRLYGSEDKIRDAQLLLTKIGVNSSVNLMAEEGCVTNKGVRRHAIYYLQITNAAKIKSRRLDLDNGRDAKAKGKWQVIKSVEELPGQHTTYCLEENELHQCVFNNVLTKQCNLSEINGKLVKSREDFCLAGVAAAIIGTLQAGYDEFEYLGEVTERIVRREALLGVSITGMMDSSDILFDPEFQKMAAELVSHTNTILAEKIGINAAARTTCIKPSGTASCLLGCASGIHLHHARRYMRQVQANKMEMPFLAFSKVNPHACEDSVWSANKTDAVISFCCEVDEKAKIKPDMTAVEFLEKVKLTQNNWVHYGKNTDRCTQPWLSHNVSNTINVRSNEWDEVGDYIFDNQDSFTAVSLLGMTGDKDYAQAPFQAVYTKEEIEDAYGPETVAQAVDLVAQGVETFGSLWTACDTVMIDNMLAGVMDKGDGKSDWAIGVRLWADRCSALGGDRQKATYCLKDVYNLSKFERLKANYRDVDYVSVIENEDDTKVQETLACAGGACSFSLDI